MNLPRPKALPFFLVLCTGITAGYSTFHSTAAVGATGTPIQIASDPPGADLYVMGRHSGTTPTTISDGDIYPVNYKADAEKFYGRVVLIKDGCEEYSRRLTRSDISNGLTAKLVCDLKEVAATSAPTTVPAVNAMEPAPTTIQSEPEVKAAAVVTADSQPHPGGESMYERRLKQLKSLQQLLDEGLISAEEEEKLRRRIIDSL